MLGSATSSTPHASFRPLSLCWTAVTAQPEFVCGESSSSVSVSSRNSTTTNHTQIIKVGRLNPDEEHASVHPTLIKRCNILLEPHVTQPSTHIFFRPIFHGLASCAFNKKRRRKTNEKWNHSLGALRKIQLELHPLLLRLPWLAS